MNSLTITQDQAEMELAVSVHRNAEIIGIRLANAKAMAVRPSETMTGPITLDMEVKSRHIARISGSLTLEINFHLVGFTKSGQQRKKRSVEVECAFEVEYELRPGFRPTAAQIQAFKDGNAIFNCWPYCRQHVQDMLMRLGYPPPTLPFLRVQTVSQQKHKKMQGASVQTAKK